MAEKNRNILWAVDCEGHTTAWVSAANWEQATVEAAVFWGVPWREVAAGCVLVKKIVGAPRNICCRCGRVYFAAPPMCDTCVQTVKQEEEVTRRYLRRAYRTGRAI